MLPDEDNGQLREVPYPEMPGVPRLYLASIKVPMAALDEGVRVIRSLEVPGMSRECGVALASVLDGLRAERACLANGRLVLSSPDAIRWILEYLSGAIEE